jgi:hypothetical protein
MRIIYVSIRINKEMDKTIGWGITNEVYYFWKLEPSIARDWRIVNFEGNDKFTL